MGGSCKKKVKEGNWKEKLRGHNLRERRKRKIKITAESEREG